MMTRFTGAGAAGALASGPSGAAGVGGGATGGAAATGGAEATTGGGAAGAAGGRATTACAGGAAAMAGRAAEVAGGGAAVTGGRATTGPAGGLAAIAGGCGGGGVTIGGAWRGCGTTRRGAGASGFGGAAGVGGGAGAAFAAGAGGAAGLAAAGGAACGRGAGRSASSFRFWISFSTSPGLETRDQSIFCAVELSPRAGDVPPLRLPPRWKCARTRCASSASSELECVFGSVTPTSFSTSRMALLLTSSSLAKSLMRTLLIRPFMWHFA